MRKHGRIDANHSEIVEGLRQTGCNVISLANLGGGIPDILCFRAKRAVLMEIKVPNEYPTTEQMLWHKNHDQCKIAVVHNLNEALEAMNKAVKA